MRGSSVSPLGPPLLFKLHEYEGWSVSLFLACNKISFSCVGAQLKMMLRTFNSLPTG